MMRHSFQGVLYALAGLVLAGLAQLIASGDLPLPQEIAVFSPILVAVLTYVARVMQDEAREAGEDHQAEA
jgi:hypothetical protein